LIAVVGTLVLWDGGDAHVFLGWGLNLYQLGVLLEEDLLLCCLVSGTHHSTTLLCEAASYLWDCSQSLP